MNKQITGVTLDVNDAQRIIDYLIEQPYKEVHELVNILLSAPHVYAEEEEKEDV